MLRLPISHWLNHLAILAMLHLSQIARIESPRQDGPIPPFVTKLVEARTGSDVSHVVSWMVRSIGFEVFEYVTLGHRCGELASAVTVCSTHREWGSRYERMGYWAIDPRLRSCQHRATPFFWDSTWHCSRDVEDFLSEAARFGLRSGIALPMWTAFGDNAMLAVSGSRGTLPDDEALQQAVGRVYILASYFHEWFVRCVRQVEGTADPQLPRLTKREREVLELTAQGHSSKRIAYDLRISESTANYHIASIRRKFRARTRSHAVAQAAQLGLLR